MQTAKWVLTISMIATSWATAHAGQGDGLVPSAESLPWSRWQARLSVNTPAPVWRAGFGTGDSQGLKLSSVSVMGDYLFRRSFSEDGSTSMLRATSGLMFGPRPTLWIGNPSGLSSAPGGFEWRHASDPSGEAMALPYLGIGYTGLAGRGGWSFSADFGLVALAGGNVVRLGRVVGGNQGLDELVRELRISPVLQFGASYAF